MDITEDEPDVKLQHDSTELVSELNTSLQPMLWKTSKSGKKMLRARVRDRDLSKLLNIVDINSYYSESANINRSIRFKSFPNS